ncbi:Uncharacterised protein [uncultured archaeon]|nr:Uncharacterised protein [uncultured archaeon]
MANALIYGSGAIGSILGYLLCSAVSSKDEKEAEIENVALLGRHGHMQMIREKGLKIDFPEDSFAERSKNLFFKHCFTSLAELEKSDFIPDLVVVCVKTYSLPKVCRELMESGMIKGRLRDSEFILLMNGMGNKDAFQPLDLPEDRIREGVTSFGVKFSRDGHIELKGVGKTVFEEKEGSRARKIEKFLKTGFEKKGFEIEFAPDFKRHQWNKLFVNSVINPITALTRKENAIVLLPELGSTVERIVAECAGVAAEEGIDTDPKSILNAVYYVAEKTSKNTSSMLQDIQRGRMTEIDSINGYVMRRAEKHGIIAPVNTALHGLVKASEKRGPG